MPGASGVLVVIAPIPAGGRTDMLAVCRPLQATHRQVIIKCMLVDWTTLTLASAYAGARSVVRSPPPSERDVCE